VTVKKRRQRDRCRGGTVTTSGRSPRPGSQNLTSDKRQTYGESFDNRGNRRERDSRLHSITTDARQAETGGNGSGEEGGNIEGLVVSLFPLLRSGRRTDTD